MHAVLPLFYTVKHFPLISAADIHSLVIDYQFFNYSSGCSSDVKSALAGTLFSINFSLDILMNVRRLMLRSENKFHEA